MSPDAASPRTLDASKAPESSDVFMVCVATAVASKSITNVGGRASATVVGSAKIYDFGNVAPENCVRKEMATPLPRSSPPANEAPT